MRYTDVWAFCFRVNRLPGIPQLNETVKHDNIRESDRHDRRYMYIPSFPLPMYKTTCHAKPYVYRSVQYRYLSTVSDTVCNLLLWLTWWWMLLYRTLRKVTSTNMRKNMYVVTPRCAATAAAAVVCCGAPTTDERIHAPVLHDASQISYCRYWGRASLPPITSNKYFVIVLC